MMSNRRIANHDKTEMLVTTEDEQDLEANGHDYENIESPDNLGEAANLQVKDETDDSPEPDDAEKQSLAKEAKSIIESNTIQGVNPKNLDDHERSQMMGFIAYATHIENSCKLLSFNKAVQFN